MRSAPEPSIPLLSPIPVLPLFFNLCVARKQGGGIPWHLPLRVYYKPAAGESVGLLSFVFSLYVASFWELEGPGWVSRPAWHALCRAELQAKQSPPTT